MAKKIMEILAQTLDYLPENTVKGLPIVQAMRCCKPPEKLTFGDISVTPFYVDHSAMDANMFLIEIDGK